MFHHYKKTGGISEVYSTKSQYKSSDKKVELTDVLNWYTEKHKTKESRNTFLWNWFYDISWYTEKKSFSTCFLTLSLSLLRLSVISFVSCMFVINHWCIFMMATLNLQTNTAAVLFWLPFLIEVDLQCCVHFWYIAKWFRYTYIYKHSFLKNSFPLWFIIGYWI